MNSFDNIPVVEFLNTRFHAIPADDVVSLVLHWQAEPVRQTHIIITANVSLLVTMRTDSTLSAAVGKADLVVTDGMPLVWASRLLGTPVPERVTGIDLMEALLERGSTERLSVYLLGTTQQRLQRFMEVVASRYPGIRIAGARNGFFSKNEYADITTEINNSGADLLLVAMPAPFKEIWCEEQRSALQIPAVLGVGGAFDVVAGFLPRAPVLLQNAGLEWAWRLCLEPRKLWKRNLTTNSRFIAILATDLARRATHH
ncbi:WecB/TagA/CpsF family glycosyltransferase [Rhizobium mongolense]|uniref:WecB/TagA/CpsF family glycosyltransferase n=1 Tax=Rhizobium TaxID=379 RepID=UPI0024B1F5E7|nr:WecB/TagA/CpsF family glycosyltransferase [Rhizobium sp. CC1099]WFU90705.1 WecB/TagA/CpsF family glycosyltransferase [Rhizobium sp. CC1099]